MSAREGMREWPHVTQVTAVHKRGKWGNEPNS